MYLFKKVLFVLLWETLCICLAKDYNKLDRHILITCHTTDFECFQRQYRSFRDHLLLGNTEMGIDAFEPYRMAYGNSGTCIKIYGLEDSDLAGITFNSTAKTLSITLEMPFKVQQVKNDTVHCRKPAPAREFDHVPPHVGPLMKFTGGNATAYVVYPFKLIKRKHDVYLQLREENLDVVLDIPDLTYFSTDREIEKKIIALSEWTYEVARHIDAAQDFILPYTTRYRTVIDNLPLKKYLLLYPEEEYETLIFSLKAPEPLAELKEINVNS